MPLEVHHHTDLVLVDELAEVAADARVRQQEVGAHAYDLVKERVARDVEGVAQRVALHGGVLDAQHEPGKVGELVLEQPKAVPEQMTSLL